MLVISLAGLGVAVAGLWIARQKSRNPFEGAPRLVINPYTGESLTAEQAARTDWL